MGAYFLRQRHRLSSRRWYWHVRARLQQIDFGIAKRGFGFKQSYADTRTSVRILLELLGIALRYIIIALALGAVFVLIGVLLAHVAPPSNTPGVLPLLMQPIVNAQHGLFDAAVIAIVTVLGLFLTLYFTNLGVLAQTILTKLPESLRTRLVRERVGNAYIRFLMILTLLALSLLLFAVISQKRFPVVLLLLGIAGLVAVPAFAILSDHSYRFLDPTALRDGLFTELRGWVRYASVEGHRWRDKSFQNFYQRKATETVRAFVVLAEIADSEPFLRTDSLAMLHDSSAKWLNWYLHRKRTIPSQSEWFPRTPFYKEWYLSPSYEVTLATASQTSLSPDLRPNSYWVETELLRSALGSLERCIGDGRVRVGTHLLNSLLSVFRTLGSEWNLRYACTYLPTTGRQLGSFVTRQPADTATMKAALTSTPEILTILELAGLLPTHLLLGFVSALQELDLRALAQHVGKTDLSNPRRIYAFDLPACCLETVEFLQSRLEFERQAEGRTVSPPWYITQLLAETLAVALHEGITMLVSQAIPFYQQATTWHEQKHHTEAAAFVTQGLQFANRVLEQLPVFRAFANRLDEMRIEKRQGWPAWAWDDIEKQVKEFVEDLELCRSSLILDVLDYSELAGIPDYFGWAVHSSGEAAFEALKANHPETFERIFRGYFVGIIIGPQHGRTDTSKWHPDYKTLAVVDPLIDLFELSGFAYYWAEYHENPRLWQACKAIWDRYFTDEGGAGRLAWIAACVAYRQALFGITDRGLLRERWSRAVAQSLRDLPRKHLHRRRFAYEIADDDDYLDVKHPSRLVHHMGGSAYGLMLMHHSGLDIFVDLYLRTLSGADNLDFGRPSGLRDYLEQRSDDESADDIE